MSDDARERDLRAVEAFFRRNGLPQLVDDARADELPAWVTNGIVVLAAAGLALLALVVGAAEAAIVAVPLVLVVGYAIANLGVVQIALHQGRPILEGLSATTSVAVRALPPLLAVLLFLSLASETWRAFGRLEGWRYGLLIGLFGLLSAVVLLLGLRAERRALGGADASIADDARATPARALVDAGVAAVPGAPRGMARAILTVALLVSLGVRVLVVGIVVGTAFGVIGLLVMDRALTAEWVGTDPHVLLSGSVGGREIVLTEALVRVATTLGAFASLYFAAVALGDKGNREDFLDDELDRLRRVMAAWAYYRGALAEGDEAQASR